MKVISVKTLKLTLQQYYFNWCNEHTTFYRKIKNAQSCHHFL